MNDTIDARPLTVSNLIWDIMPAKTRGYTIQKVQERLGLHPSDVEGLEVENRLSEARKQAIVPIAPVIMQLSGWSAEVVMAKNLCELEESAGMPVIVPDEVKSAVWTQTATQIVTTSAAIIAHLLETGVIKLGDGLE